MTQHSNNPAQKTGYKRILFSCIRIAPELKKIQQALLNISISDKSKIVRWQKRTQILFGLVNKKNIDQVYLQKKRVYIIAFAIFVGIFLNSTNPILPANLAQAYEGMSLRSPSLGEAVDVDLLNLSDAPLLGNENSPIEIILFNDFQHLYDQEIRKALLPLLEKYKGYIHVYSLQFPLGKKDISLQAANIMLAAKEQGKYWDLFMEVSKSAALPSMDQLVELAQNIGIDTAALQAGVESKSQEYESLIDINVRQTKAIGADGIPYYIINGRLHFGEKQTEQLEYIILDELLDQNMKSPEILHQLALLKTIMPGERSICN